MGEYLENHIFAHTHLQYMQPQKLRVQRISPVMLSPPPPRPTLRLPRRMAVGEMTQRYSLDRPITCYSKHFSLIGGCRGGVGQSTMTVREGTRAAQSWKQEPRLW